jgi:large subunit ribosomal protein L2
MALKNYNPTSPARRGLILVDKSALWKGKPVKALTEGKRKTGGRNNKGHVTSRGIAGGHKQKYRFIDFKRRKWDAPPASSSGWNTIPTAPRSSRWSSTRTANSPTSWRRSACRGRHGVAGEKTDVKPGNAMLLSQMPVGTICPQRRDEAGQGRPDRPFGRDLRAARRS